MSRDTQEDVPVSSCVRGDAEQWADRNDTAPPLKAQPPPCLAQLVLASWHSAGRRYSAHSLALGKGCSPEPQSLPKGFMLLKGNGKGNVSDVTWRRGSPGWD